MKNNILLILAIFLMSSSLLSAQIEKGATLQSGLGGLGFYQEEWKNTPELNNEGGDLSLSYQFLYFVTDHWALGGGLGGSVVSGSSGGGILPSVRYYFNPENESSNWFASTSAIFSIVSGDGSNVSFDVWNIGGGVDFFLNSNVVFETGLGLNFYQDNGSFFKRPELNLGTSLLVYLSPENRKEKKTAVSNPFLQES